MYVFFKLKKAAQRQTQKGGKKKPASHYTCKVISEANREYFVRKLSLQELES